MIKILNKTDKYNIEPRKIITNSFEAAYEKTAVDVPVKAPDTLVTVFTVISLLLLAGMLYLTAIYDKSKDANAFFMVYIRYSMLWYNCILSIQIF